MRRCGAACMWRGGASARRRAASGWPERRCARCCATACRRGIAGRSRSGVRSWRPSRGSSIRSSVTISTGRRSNATRPRASASARGARLHGRLHDRQSLRARAEAGRARDVCAARASTGRRPGRRRRSAGGHRRRRTQGARPGRGSAAQRRRVREGLSGGDDGGVLRWAHRDDVGGVPRRIVYDNTTLAVARMLGDGTRQRTRVFSELQSHDLFDDRFGRPGKGNDTGKVEADPRVRKLEAFTGVGGICKFPICGNRKPHTLVVGGLCPAFHDVGESNSEGAGHRCMDGRRGCC